MRIDMKRFFVWALPLALLVVGIVFAFLPRAEPVDLVSVSQGPMLVTVDEEGETRVREVFTVAAPIGGRLLRTALDVGDSVVANETIVLQIEPSEPDFLDQRTQTSNEAARDAADAALQLAEAELKQAQAEHEFAEAELTRARKLFAKGTLPKQPVDDAERAALASAARVDAATANINVREHELSRAKASLITPLDLRENDMPCACISVTAPTSGSVLRLYQESETVVAAGTPVLDIGDPEDLEIVADFISVDAVQVRAGQRVIIDDWGGDGILNGVVRRVEPFGFTKVSALGIEEQRVNVIIDITDSLASWRTLGHGYQVEVKVVQWEADGAVQAPITALFRDQDSWAVFVADGGRARQRAVEIGHTAGLDVEVVQGLADGDSVLLHPSAKISDGARIQQR